MGLDVKLKKKFEGFDVDLSFSMGKEFLVFFGPSGSGKTVSLRMIAGLLQPDEGYVKLAEREFLDTKKKLYVKPQERQMGYVFQNHSIFPHMTVLENIHFGSQEKNPKEAWDMIEMFHLAGLEKKYPHEISGGQKQRVALAMNFIRRPKALLLDEPFSALDTPLRIKMRDCLKGVMERFQIPIILVTHDEAEAHGLGDRILVFEQGRIVRELGHGRTRN